MMCVCMYVCTCTGWFSSAAKDLTSEVTFKQREQPRNTGVKLWTEEQQVQRPYGRDIWPIQLLTKSHCVWRGEVMVF